MYYANLQYSHPLREKMIYYVPNYRECASRKQLLGEFPTHQNVPKIGSLLGNNCGNSAGNNSSIKVYKYGTRTYTMLQDVGNNRQYHHELTYNCGNSAGNNSITKVYKYRYAYVHRGVWQDVGNNRQCMILCTNGTVMLRMRCLFWLWLRAWER
jgi:hypothetical protein